MIPAKAMKPQYQTAKYMKSVHYLKDLPPDSGIEIAFAGRSNAGKSSAINAITNVRSLAHTSKTPGRTQQINYFQMDNEQCLVDLPGYGYAKVPEKIRRHWQQLLNTYFEKRLALKGLFLIMDIRHPLTPFDLQMLSFCNHKTLPTHLLLTKADKLKRGAAMNTLLRVRTSLAEHDHVSLQLFSATKKTGIEEARNKLDDWFMNDAPNTN